MVGLAVIGRNTGVSLHGIGMGVCPLHEYLIFYLYMYYHIVTAPAPEPQVAGDLEAERDYLWVAVGVCALAIFVMGCTIVWAVCYIKSYV